MTVNEIILYLRKSRADQDNETVEEVLRKHEIQLQEYAQHNFAELIPEENIFREVMSGETIEDRPQMQAVLKQIESNRIRAVLVIEPQRLTRGSLQDCGQIITAFQYSDTKVITPMKTYDLSNEFDREFFEMELMSGKKYLEYTKKILNRGRMASVNRGNYIGTYSPYGYNKIKIGKDCTLVPNEFSEIVKMIYELYTVDKLSLVAIADKLNNMEIKPLRSMQFESFSIRAILTNPIYKGYLRWGFKKTVHKMEDGKKIKKNPIAKDGEYILVKGKHPAIISDEVFESAQKRIGQNPRVTRERPLANILAGVFYCQCGKAMNYRVYRKDGVDKCQPRFHCTKQKFCHTKGASAKQIISTIKSILIDDITEFEIELKHNERINATNSTLIESFKAELAVINKQQERLYIFLENGTYSEKVFKERSELLEDKRTALVTSINNLKSDNKNTDYHDLTLKLQNLVLIIDDTDVSNVEKNNLIKLVIHKIIYSNTGTDFSISIEYNM